MLVWSLLTISARAMNADSHKRDDPGEEQGLQTLFHGNRLGEVSRLVDIGAFENRNVVGE